jgi:hypothetical protein
MTFAMSLSDPTWLLILLAGAGFGLARMGRLP